MEGRRPQCNSNCRTTLGLPKYKLTLEYDGTDFAGFQIQNNARTVQGVLEKALKTVYKSQTKITGASRTDSGVHAEGQVAHFSSEKKIDPSSLLKAINSNLPEDAAVREVEVVPEEFHARFHAKKKRYEYVICLSNLRSPLARRRTYFYYYPVDTQKLIQAAKCLVGTHDFKSFQAKSSEKEEMSAVRTLSKLDIRCEGDKIHFAFEGNGFLYNMVRNIVGSLLEVGRKKMSGADFKKKFKACNRKLMGPTAPAYALTLKKIIY